MDGRKIANYIQWKRKELGLTIEQLSAEVGVPRYLIEKWEEGEIPSTEYLLPLAKVLQTEVEELLIGRDEVKEISPTPPHRETVKTELEQAPPKIEPKDYYETLNEKIKNIDYSTYEIDPSSSNGFWDGERKFGYVFCCFFLALMLLVNVSNLFAWVVRPRQITLENCNDYLSVEVYPTEVFDPTDYEIKLTLKKGSYPIYNLSVTVKVTFERINLYQLGEEEVIRYAELTASVLKERQSITATVSIPHHMYYEKGGKIVEVRGNT